MLCRSQLSSSTQATILHSTRDTAAHTRAYHMTALLHTQANCSFERPLLAWTLIGSKRTQRRFRFVFCFAGGGGWRARV